MSQCFFAFFDANDTLDATARPTDRAEKGNNRARTALANAFKAESGVMTVLQRTNAISPEHTRLGRQISDRLNSTPLGGSTEMKDKLTGKFVTETVRLIVLSKETAKMITEQAGQISKLDAAMQQNAEMMQQLIKITGANDQQTKGSQGGLIELGRRHSSLLRRSKRLAWCFRKRRRQRRSRRTAVGVRRPRLRLRLQAAQLRRLRETHGRRRRAVVGVVAARSGAQAVKWGGAVSEDCGGLDDDDDGEHTVPSPSIAERTRSRIGRRIAAIRLFANGGGSAGGTDATDAGAESDAAVDAELGWAEHIKQQYDVGDCDDAQMAAVLDAIQHTESTMAQAKIDDMYF